MNELLKPECYVCLSRCSIGSHIKKLRITANISEEDMATRLGITLNELTLLEINELFPTDIMEDKIVNVISSN